MNSVRKVFRHGDIVHIFRLGLTSNEKICHPYELAMQTYHFSRQQYEFLMAGGKGINTRTGLMQASLTEANCGVCPLREKGCYTHKFNQAMGLKMSLTSVLGMYGDWGNIPTYQDTDVTEIVTLSVGQYVRFGSYGNPDTMPIELVKDMVKVSRNHTGYTHNWKNPEKEEYLDYFMASAHNNLPEWNPTESGNFRYFVTDGNEGVMCPASDEYEERTGKKVTCSDCGLCSGRLGKGKGNVKIASH